jgi:hypothetical protein
VKKIELTQGKAALVDDEDFQRVIDAGPWHAYLNRGHWYAQRSLPRVNGVQITQSLHRFIVGLGHGDPKKVDHKDRVNTLDNRRENLRVATSAQNSQNVGKTKTNTSGFKGVSWHKQTEKWQAGIKVNYKRIHLGYFTSPAAAAIARDEAALLHHKEYAVTNEMLGLLKKPVASVTDWEVAA